MILRISDRYIIRSFLFSFAICFLALVSLFIVIDTFANLSSLVEHASKAVAAPAAPTQESSDGRVAGVSADSSGPIAKPPASPSAGVGASLRNLGRITGMLVTMNASRLPLIFYELAPFITLSAAMFTIARLKKANEITPLLASGVSIYRVVWPIFLMAIVLTICQMADREVIIPRYSEDLVAWERMRNTSGKDVRARAMVEDGYGNIIFAGQYHIPSRTQRSAQITRYWSTEGGRPMVMINAETAIWRERPEKGWLYSEGKEITFDAAGNVLRQAPIEPEGLFVPLSIDGPRPDAFDIATDVGPQDIEAREVDIVFRPTLWLLQYVHDHGLRTDIALDLNRRIAGPLGNMVLLLIGLPFALKTNVKSPFLAIMVAVFIALAYIATGLVTENFALKGQILTPLTGAWAPIIIFGPIGVVLFDGVES